MNTSVTALPNSQAEIQKRIADGKITWAGPLIMLSSRTVIGLILTALVAAIFFRGSADPWAEAFLWWRVYGALVGLGCLIPLFYLARREGISILDLGNYSRKGWLRDVLIGVGLFVPFILLGMGGIVGGMALLQYTPPVATEQLPTWATLFTIIIWPIIWTFSEDNTYVGYSLPRVEALTGGRKWLVVVVVWFFLSLQHIFSPTGLAWQAVVSWFIALIPLYSVVLLALVALGSIVAHNGWSCVSGYCLSADSLVSLGITTDRRDARLRSHLAYRGARGQ